MKKKGIYFVVEMVGSAEMLGFSRVLRWCHYGKLIILVEFGNDLK